MNHNQKIIFAIGIIVIATISTIYLVNDIFITEAKPVKPDLSVKTIQDPAMIAIFDSLYEKHPNITQNDIETAFADLSILCLEIQENESAQLTTMAFCKGYMNGTIENWLDAMNIPYYSSTSSLLPPELIL